MKLNLFKPDIIRKQSWLYKLRSNAQLLVLCLPAMLLLLILNYLPMAGLILAFKDFRVDRGFFGSEWIGFKNFEFFFKSDVAWRVTRNTVFYNAVFIITGTVLAIVLAMLLSEIIRNVVVKIYRTIIFIPNLLSWVTVSCILFAFLKYDLGFLNKIIASFGGQPPDWYFDPKLWPFIFVIMNMWKNLGYSTMIYYVAILGIDREYYEAATIDGASKFQMNTRITLPLLMPMISLFTLISIGRIFSANFDMFFNLPKDNGLLYSTTDVIDTFVYRSLRVTGDTGMSIAAGAYQSVVGFLLVLGSNYIIKKKNRENAIF